jgi:hypothetical protein
LNSFGRSRTVSHLVTLPWDMTVHGSRYQGELGPLLLAFALAAALLNRTRRSRGVEAAAGGVDPLAIVSAVAVIYLALWASPLSSFQIRFVVPVVPLLAVVGAVGWAAVPDRVPRMLLAGLLVLQLPPFTPLHEADGWLTTTVHEIPLGVVVGGESPSAYLSRALPSYAAWSYINRTLPNDALVLTMPLGDTLYAKRCRLYVGSAAAGPATYLADPSDPGYVLEHLRALGATDLLVDRRESRQLAAIGEPFPLLDQRVIDAGLQLVYEDWYEQLFHLVVQPSPAQLAAGRRFACPR